jgi:hypothetical protein
MNELRLLREAGLGLLKHRHCDVMTPEVLSSYPQIQELHVAEVLSYLQQNQWMSVSHASPRLLLLWNKV